MVKTTFTANNVYSPRYCWPFKITSFCNWTENLTTSASLLFLLHPIWWAKVLRQFFARNMHGNVGGRKCRKNVAYYVLSGISILLKRSKHKKIAAQALNFRSSQKTRMKLCQHLIAISYFTQSLRRMSWYCYEPMRTKSLSNLRTLPVFEVWRLQNSFEETFSFQISKNSFF